MIEDPRLLNPLGELCQCVEHHEPRAFVPTYHHIVPKSWGGETIDENMVWLCPNSHTAVHRLIDEYVRLDGKITWEIAKHFSPFQRELAADAWRHRPADPTITSLEFQP